MSIQNVHLGIGYRAPDGHRIDLRMKSLPHHKVRHIVGAFRRPIGIHQQRGGLHRLPTPGQIHGKGLAGHQQPAQARQMLASDLHLLDNGAQQRGHSLKNRDLQPFRQIDQQGRIVRLFLAHNQNAPSGQQRRKKLPNRDIEAQRSGLRHGVRGRKMQVSDLGVQVIDHSALNHHDTLGLTGRAGGVDDVGQLRGTESLRSQVGFWRVLPLRCRGQVEDRPGTVAGKQLGQMALGEQHDRSGVLEHKGKPLGRILGVQRNVSSSCLEHGQQRHQHL